MRGIQGIVIVAVLSIGRDTACALAREFPSGPPVAKVLSELQTPEAAQSPQDPGSKSTSSDSAIGESSMSPVVQYQDGELTITAENAPLTEILAELRKCLGAEIQVSGATTGQRVWAKLGPGPARKVVSDLLSDTEFNYVIQGSTTDPGGIRSVMLSPHTKPAANEGMGAGAQTARNRHPAAEEAEAKEPDTVAGAVNSSSAAPAELQPQAPDLAPARTPVAATTIQPQERSGGASAAGGTAEQMAQQLQSMYQQRRQIQVNQNTQNQKTTAAPNL